LNPAYDADHWKELNTKLDENENPKGWLSRWSLGIGLAVLFSGSSLLYFTVNNSTSNPDSPLATSLGQEDIIPGERKNAVAPEEPLADDQSKSIQESKATNPSGHSASELPAVAESRASSLPTVVQQNTKVEPELDKPTGRHDASNHVASTNDHVTADVNETISTGNPAATSKELKIENGNDDAGISRNIQDSISTLTTDPNERNNSSNAISKANGVPILDSAEPLDHENTNISNVEIITNSDTKDTVSLALAQTREALAAEPNEGIGREQPATQVEASTLVIDSVKAETQLQDKEEADPAPAEKDEEEKSIRSGPRLSVKLSLSPDFSSVGYSHFTRPGTNYGVLIEYHLGTSVSVVTGAIWSKKIYTASDVEYNGHKAYKAEGDCRILDIPINVNYSFRSTGSLSFYAGLGFSSYIMNREDYVFHVKSSYGSSYTYDRKVRGENNEIFSVLNLSVGAQKQLGSRWALQFEPFVKQSVRGIGDGSLSLSSLGAFLNLRYSLLSKQPN
jgi:hypothetical protein